MTDVLFDPSWWMYPLAVALAVGVWWQGNVRQDKALKRAGAVVLLLAGAWFALAWFVATEKETVERKSRLLVDAVNRRDWATFRSLLDPRTSFPPLYANADDITQGAQRTADSIGFKKARIFGMTVDQKDSVIVVDFSALSEQERSMGQQVITSWRFDWQDRGSGFKLYTITPLKSRAIDPSQIIGNLERVR